jgi:2'-5' RNA ligase
MEFPLRSAFIALPLEGQPKWQFQALQQELESFVDILTFQNPQSPHLTLYFWKELLEIEYKDVLPKIENIAAKRSPFTLQVNGVDTFGKAGDERVLFLTVAFSPELATLKKLCPWPNPPDQPFHPHITVARIRHPQKFAVHRKKIMKVFEGISFAMPLDRLRLYGEVNGVKQTIIGEFPLH